MAGHKLGGRSRIVLAAPFVVGLTLVAIVYGAASYVAESRRTALQQSDQIVVNEIGTRLETFVETRLAIGRHTVEDLATRFRTGESMDALRRAFRIEAESFLDLYPDMQAMNWVNADGVITDIYPVAGNEPARGVDLSQHPVAGEYLRAATESGDIKLSEPIDLAQGGTGIVAYAPVSVAGPPIGYVNLVFRARPLIQSALPGDIRDKYHLAILDGEKALTGSRQRTVEAHTVTDRVEAGGRTWEVRLTPRGTLTEARTSIAEPIMFGLSLAAAVAIGGLLWLALRRGDELARSEKRFRDYSETSSDFFWEMDADLRVSYVSRRYEELTGTSRAEMLGKGRADMPRPPGMDEAVWQRHLDDLAAHRPFRDFVHARVRPDGETVWLAVSGKPIYDAEGAFAGYRGTGRDATPEVAELEEMRQLRQEADQASRAKSVFLAHMSHDLRTPLNSIIGFSSVLDEKMFGPLGDKRYEDYVGYIRRSGEMLLDLVNDILDLSRIESHEYTLERTWLDIGALLAALSGRYRLLLSASEERLTHAAPTGSVRLHADERAVTQILDNLVTNAAKHAGPEARIVFGWRDAADGGGILFVADEGRGIPPEIAARATEPFVSGAAEKRSTARSENEGSGLGLTIVAKLAALHGARLAIDSRPGAGTEITIAFPPEQVDRRGASEAAGDAAGRRADDADILQ